MGLAGAQEVAALLGLSTKRVHQLTGTGSFPDPVAELACGRIWLIEAVQTWKAETRPGDDLPIQVLVPPRDPAMPQADPWDADAVRWLQATDVGATFRPDELLGSLREQPALVRRDPDRVEQALQLAWDLGLDRRRDVGGRTIHLFRTDLGRPASYPRSAAERRKWLKESRS